MSELAEAVRLLTILHTRLGIASIVWLTLLTIAVAFLYYDRKHR